MKRDTAFAQILATMSTEFVEGKKKKRKAKLVEVIESAWPPKVRRRLRYKQGVFAGATKKVGKLWKFVDFDIFSWFWFLVF